MFAADLDGVGSVAVKVLRQRHEHNELAIKDLESEAAIMAGLKHEGILRAVGIGASGRAPFLVLERLHELLSAALPKSADGLPYWERRRQTGKWPLARALQCGLELAEALRYCHDEAVPGFRLMHRDLKPDNIGFLADGQLQAGCQACPACALIRAVPRRAAA